MNLKNAHQFLQKFKHKIKPQQIPQSIKSIESFKSSNHPSSQINPADKLIFSFLKNKKQQLEEDQHILQSNISNYLQVINLLLTRLKQQEEEQNNKNHFLEKIQQAKQQHRELIIKKMKQFQEYRKINFYVKKVHSRIQQYIRQILENEDLSFKREEYFAEIYSKMLKEMAKTKNKFLTEKQFEQLDKEKVQRQKQKEKKPKQGKKRAIDQQTLKNLKQFSKNFKFPKK